MTGESGRTDADELRRNQPDGHTAASRRAVLRGAAGAGALVAGLGTTAAGAAAASPPTPKQMPTPPLHVEGNHIVDPTGNEVVLRGVNIADPKRLDVTAPARGKNAEQVIDLATDAETGWHARVIRLPVQPVDIGEHPPGQGPPPVAFSRSELESYLENHLDPAVRKCKQENVYCIIDYHRHRDIEWTDPDLAEEIELFWDAVAARYGDRPHVLFEVYNEPQTPGMWGPIDNPGVRDTWLQWKETAQPWVDTIREYADNVVIVGSPSWSQSPEGALIEEFDGGNLAYSYHIYPGHGISQSENWDADASWANGGEGTNAVYEEVPLFVTEWGYEPDAGSVIGGTTEGFGEPFREWLNSGPIHWTAWNFDPIWQPVAFERPFETESVGNPYEGEVPELCSDRPCEWTLLDGDHQGAFVKAFLDEYKYRDLPIWGDRFSDGGESGNGRGSGK